MIYFQDLHNYILNYFVRKDLEQHFDYLIKMTNNEYIITKSMEIKQKRLAREKLELENEDEFLKIIYDIDNNTAFMPL